jgi:hypothetical protein
MRITGLSAVSNGMSTVHRVGIECYLVYPVDSTCCTVGCRLIPAVVSYYYTTLFTIIVYIFNLAIRTRINTDFL